MTLHTKPKQTNGAKILHPDAKGRITLGAMAKGISSYRMTKDENGLIILDPYVEIAAALIPGWLEGQSKHGFQESNQESNQLYRHGAGQVRKGMIDFFEQSLGEAAGDIGDRSWSVDHRPLGSDFSE